LEVDPDLCVAMGAAVQGGLISGVDVGPVLVDITPHTLGIQVVSQLHGYISPYCSSPIIHRNTALPANRAEFYSTMVDNQECVEINVYQGEDQDVRHNERIGQFELSGLAEVKRGNEILVRFDLDLDGILKVTATERSTGLETQLTVENAIQRFRDTRHEEAKQRLDAAFGAAVSPARSGTDKPVPRADSSGDVPSAGQVPELVVQAEKLIDKAGQVASNAAPEDAAEMETLVQQLRDAIQRRCPPEEISQAVSQLEDLVFYVQDV
jgi:molecular chaperone DnaK